MALNHSPSIVTNGLVFALDVPNLKSFGPFTVQALVVAGGGGGGGWGGGGGGGGLLYSNSLPVTVGTAYTVTVGLGGTAGTVAYSSGGDGGNSVFSTLTAIGGGGGGNYPAVVGRNGGSGGGGGGNEGTAVQAGGTGTAGQGNAGGTSNSRNDGNYWGAGGGGGAGAAGANAVTYQGGAGGDGLQYGISGLQTWYAGGGGGHTPNAPGTYAIAQGGRGGGGQGGSYYQGISASSGTANTGGGGGGAHGSPTVIGAGGSGIVIIRYAGAQKATGGTITSLGGYTIHTFTASGTFTSGTNWGDTSGNNFTGALINGPTYNSANGGSLVFNGSNTYVNIPYNSNFDFPGDFAVCVWLYPTAYAMTYQTIIDTYPGGAQNGWIFTTMNGGTNAISWYTQGCAWCQSSAAVDLNSWNFLVATRIGSTTKVYKNAIEILSVTDTLNITGGDLNIGRGLVDGYGPINGRISNVAIYKGKGFTQADVQQNFNALRGRYNI